MRLVFWLCAAAILYVYAGYPLLLRSGLLGRRRPVRRRAIEPAVGILVPAHNEERCIEAKIESLLALDYPRDKLRILVGSDGSTDHTADVVRRFAGHRVGLIVSRVQLGKSGIENRLAEAAGQEILVFTDADCRPSPDAVRKLVENFADQNVGLVTVRPVYGNARETEIGHNEGIYWRYENWLRREESERGLLAMASGSFFGIRRSLWKRLDPNVGDDFVLPLAAAERGMRTVVDERIHVGIELAAVRAASMFAMKKRIVSKDLRGLIAHRRALNPLATGAVAVALLSHKLLRWLVPYLLCAMLASNLFLLGDGAFRALFAMQLLFYAAAAMASLPGKGRLHSLFSIPKSFCVVNGAALAGTLHCVAGGTAGTWKPERER